MASILGCLLITAAASAGVGDWPEPRQNSALTAHQPAPGKMHAAPKAIAQYDFGRGQPTVTPATNAAGETVGLSVFAGALFSYDTEGRILWRAHPAGLNFEMISAARDLDGDGQVEVLLQAGRSAMPYGAAALVSLETGELLWRYDVDPMSYAWYLYAGKYLPGAEHEQIIVLMHGYPPDPQNGYIALFEFAAEDRAPKQRWRYDFDHYTCFPSLLQTDLDGDGKQEIVVETHSRMWLLNAESGEVKQFLQWDVSPANIRSYGLVQFVDLDQDGREDFLCIANFAQHHEVLLNKAGKLEKAWHYGWPESVTVGKVVTTYPEPAYGDLDGDGNLEVVVSMYNSEDKAEWLVRAYDAVTGTIEYTVPGVDATTLVDVDGDGKVEVLGNRTNDPARSVLEGAVLLGVSPGAGESIEAGGFDVRWEKPSAQAGGPKADGNVIVLEGEERFALKANEAGEIALEPWVKQKQPAKQAFTSVPSVVGPPLPQLLAADLLPQAGNELIHYDQVTATVFSLADGALIKGSQYASSCLPVVADFDADGVLDFALTEVTPTAPPRVKVICPAQGDRVVWEVSLPPTERVGLPQPRKAYLRAGRFTGGTVPDLYLWAGTPLVRSVVLRGTDGSLIWERGEIPGNERYWGPSMNFASIHDYNADGKDDLVFTNPDYYCVAEGGSGELLLGPAFPPKIFNQPSQALYTIPALLSRADAPPLVALVSGHYFQGVMSLDSTQALWHTLPMPGDARAAAEGFAPLPDGTWTMGFARQNGHFACINVLDGTVRWEVDLQASASDAVSCDINADGRPEYLVGTSHGEVIALGEGEEHVVWRWKNDGAGLGSPLPVDLDGDGAVEIVVADTAGYLHVLQ